MRFDQGRPSGRLRPAVRSAARRCRVRGARAPVDPGTRPGRAGVGPQADARSVGHDRRLLSRRATTRRADDVATALDSFSARAMALDLTAAYGRARRAQGRPAASLLLSAAVEGQRLQAAEPVSALDGAARRARSRRLDARVAVEAGRAARHARDSRRPLPAADALYEPGLGDGARHHRVAPADRPARSGPLRLLALPPGHDERLRLQPRAG